MPVLLDEAGTCLGGGMPAIEQSLVIGRSYGIRLMMFYQSLSQLKGVFKGEGKDSLVLDNCDQVYFAAQGANAKAISDRTGNYTETATSYLKTPVPPPATGRDRAAKT